jgi:phytoene/squalene synthetase
MNQNRDEFLAVFHSINFGKIKDHPNILIAANFWEKERYEAAKDCYRFMRSIDDLIDDHKAGFIKISPDEKIDFRRKVEEWLGKFTHPPAIDASSEGLTSTIRRFLIPLWPLRDFAHAMMYDIDNDGFATFDAFLEYARGASVAPASIFVHLAGLRNRNGRYMEPTFNVKEVATPCAIFSYIVHILRDFQKDQLSNLNYFADELLLKHGLTRQDLRNIAEGSPLPRNFRNMAGDYCERALYYMTQTKSVMQKIKPLLGIRYQLSLEIIFDLYMMVFEKIDPKNGRFMTSDLLPDPEETKDRVYRVIMKFSPSW